MVTKVQCLIRMWLAARRAKARLAASSSSPGSTVDDAGYNSKGKSSVQQVAKKRFFLCKSINLLLFLLIFLPRIST